RIVDCHLEDRVTMVGAVERDQRERLFSTSDVLVVPSHSENFAMVIAEALAHALPVIASRGTPWKRLAEIGCGLWVEHSREGLAEAIEGMPHRDRRHMGVTGRAWMAREFSWSGVARRMLDVSQAVAGPSSVRDEPLMGAGTA